MPLTIQATEGLFTQDAQDAVIKAVTEAILRANNQLNVPLARRHLIATFLAVPGSATYADGQPAPFVLINIRNPTGSLATGEQRQRFVRDAHDAVMANLSQPLDRDRLYINLIEGTGLWGIGASAYNPESIGEWFSMSTPEDPGF